MKIIVPADVSNVISKIGNKTAQKSALKIYGALLRMSKRKNKHGYFPVSSKYLKSVNSRYTTIIKAFLDAKIIDYKYTTEPHPTNLFETVKIKSYNVAKNICMKYKFQIDISKGQFFDIDMSTNRKFRWYEIIEKSLISLGYPVKISRDTFGRRVHHSAIRNHKSALMNKGLIIIDAQCSQPRFLLQLMKESGIVDQNYEDALKNDFYTYIKDALKLNKRDDAKKLFMYFLNAKTYVPNYLIHQLFPVASKYLKNLKASNHKDSASLFQRMESKIWIDDLLTNIQSSFALPVHDCLIIKEEEADKILNYCQKKYPDMVFHVSKL